MTLNDLKTPFYLCDLRLVRQNLRTLRQVAQDADCDILCALKGFAFSGAMPLCAELLAGATCSGLGEARYAAAHGFKSICTYSPAFKEDEIDEILQLSDHIIFNSFSQLARFGARAAARGVSVGLRVNPQTSFSPTDAYNPCGRFSRLGVTAQALRSALREPENAALFALCEGLHFHALCEESAQSLQRVVAAFERDFGEFVRGRRWVNFGGGHHITRAGYDTALLVRVVGEFAARHGVRVVLEPGEAVGWRTGVLVASVLDIVENERKICIIDASPECHMPDTVLMPYRPSVRGEIGAGDGAEIGGAGAANSNLTGAGGGNGENLAQNLAGNGGNLVENQLENSLQNGENLAGKSPKNPAQTAENPPENSAQTAKNAPQNPPQPPAPFECYFGAATCLAGDVVGLAAGAPLYRFGAALKVGDRVVFEDQIHYTIVKNNTFNGVKLPDLAQINERGEVEIVREFDYDEYSRRN